MRMASTLACLLVPALAACSPPSPPEEERRPDPQAVASRLPVADACRHGVHAVAARMEIGAAKAALDTAAG